VVGLIGTGGLDSIFLPLLPVQLAAVCMLAPSRRAVPVGSGMALGFAAACLIKYPATTDPARLTLFTGFSLALVWMIAALARTANAQRQRFIQVAAHELRTPMTAIKAICALVRGQVAAGREIPDNLLPLLSQEVERLSSLLTEATAVFGLQAGRLDAELIPLDLKKVAGAAVAVATTIDPSHTYVLETGPAPLAVMGNSRCLEAVFGNLLDNAVKYSPPDTTISVALTDAGGWARAAIADQGEGIPATELRNLRTLLPPRPPPGQGPRRHGVGAVHRRSTARAGARAHLGRE
jgi:signal transduction histidine kinase